MACPGSFDLTTEPWLLVQHREGHVEEVSLRALFRRAGELRGIVGEIPTQTFALTRLALAVLHRAVAGPQDAAHWKRLWDADALPVEEIDQYLDTYVDRFDLLHPEAPFYQVADLRTATDGVSTLDKLIADVPNGEPYFTTRIGPGISRISLAEAARWTVHCQAFDPSGIKSGAVGDPRVKGSRGYPLGVAWAGSLGGLLVEGRSLRETLLLNLVPWGRGGIQGGPDDLSVWERPPSGPAEADLSGRPTGPVDLYTWQSRRLRLACEDGWVTGVIIAYGDRLPPHNQHLAEPLTAWRRSEPQEKKHGLPLVYMPREHRVERALWRGLEALLPSRSSRRLTAQGARALVPGVSQWLGEATSMGLVPSGYRIRTRALGMTYGTMSATVAEVIDDSVSMALVLLQDQDVELATIAADAAAAGEQGARALGSLAANLAMAAGGEPDGPRDRAQELAYAELDHRYRAWLAGIAPDSDDDALVRDWHVQAASALRALASDLIQAAGPAAWTGRTIKERTSKERRINTPIAEAWFAAAIRRTFPRSTPSSQREVSA